jgi:hypothetical protein
MLIYPEPYPRGKIYYLNMFKVQVIDPFEESNIMLELFSYKFVINLTSNKGNTDVYFIIVLEKCKFILSAMLEIKKKGNNCLTFHHSQAVIRKIINKIIKHAD